MERKLKTISRAGINEALAKAEVYRFLNEPEEAESICRDVLAVEPAHQVALRLLGLALTDQFTGGAGDRYAEVERIFSGLKDAYEHNYYLGLSYERRAKAQLRAGQPPHTLMVLFEHAMHHFEEAEKMRPAGNDDAILRWNRCVRLLEGLSATERHDHIESLAAGDSHY